MTDSCSSSSSSSSRIVDDHCHLAAAGVVEVAVVFRVHENVMVVVVLCKDDLILLLVRRGVVRRRRSIYLCQRVRVIVMLLTLTSSMPTKYHVPRFLCYDKVLCSKLCFILLLCKLPFFFPRVRTVEGKSVLLACFPSLALLSTYFLLDFRKKRESVVIVTTVIVIVTNKFFLTFWLVGCG